MGYQQCVYSRAKECALFIVLARVTVIWTRCIGWSSKGLPPRAAKSVACNLLNKSKTRGASLDDSIGWGSLLSQAFSRDRTRCKIQCEYVSWLH